MLKNDNKNKLNFGHKAAYLIGGLGATIAPTVASSISQVAPVLNSVAAHADDNTNNSMQQTWTSTMNVVANGQTVNSDVITFTYVSGGDTSDKPAVYNISDTKGIFNLQGYQMPADGNVNYNDILDTEKLNSSNIIKKYNTFIFGDTNTENNQTKYSIPGDTSSNSDDSTIKSMAAQVVVGDDGNQTVTFDVVDNPNYNKVPDKIQPASDTLPDGQGDTKQAADDNGDNTTTTKNDDGSTTVTVNDGTTITSTTTYPDGHTSVVSKDAHAATADDNNGSGAGTTASNVGHNGAVDDNGETALGDAPVAKQATLTDTIHSINQHIGSNIPDDAQYAPGDGKGNAPANFSGSKVGSFTGVNGKTYAVYYDQGNNKFTVALDSNGKLYFEKDMGVINNQLGLTDANGNLVSKDLGGATTGANMAGDGSASGNLASTATQNNGNAVAASLAVGMISLTAGLALKKKTRID